VIAGSAQNLESSINILLSQGFSPLEIINGPLLDGMKEVSERFGDGRMFLPQVIRSAGIMKKTVDFLAPHLSTQNNNSNTALARRPKIVLATVKGDVHDIGKNIVALVLSISGCEVLDLGVMAASDTIIETAIKNDAAFIGLSALISPSLNEMCIVASAMEKRNLKIPLLIGGAAASLAHTALKIVPLYSGPVVYIADASQCANIISSLTVSEKRKVFLEELSLKYSRAVKHHLEVTNNTISLEEARANRKKIAVFANDFPPPKQEGTYMSICNISMPVVAYINWKSFLRKWAFNVKEKTDTIEHEKELLLKDASNMIMRIVKEKLLELRQAVCVCPALSDDEIIIIYKEDFQTEITRFAFPRRLTRKEKGKYNLCLSDFVISRKTFLETGQKSYIGFFICSAAFALDNAKKTFYANGDDYGAVLISTLAQVLTEAASEQLHQKVRREIWGYAPQENLSIDDMLAGKYQGIRPAFGYSCCPEHSGKQKALALLDAQNKLGFSLTETDMLLPAASICGMYFSHPESCYF
jgi:5-methyltetrahydrofolate--homocysteine methyltransferase